MAHGGSAEWDAQAVAPLKGRIPVALALGMADPVTLQAALDSLADAGVERVAVVRLFLSGASFLHQTEYLLGLRQDAPAHPILHHGGGGHHGSATLHPLAHGMEIRLSRDGLGAADVARRILVDRATAASLDPAAERVLVLAHGMEDDEENAQVLAHMQATVDALRAQGFQDAFAATLREDWPEARAASEAAIRAWMTAETGQGTRTLVVPFRLSGFGPYAEVLEGLDYTPTPGLLPHDGVAAWVAEQAFSLLCGEEAEDGLARCPFPKSVATPLP